MDTPEEPRPLETEFLPIVLVAATVDADGFGWREGGWIRHVAIPSSGERGCGKCCLRRR